MSRPPSVSEQHIDHSNNIIHNHSSPHLTPDQPDLDLDLSVSAPATTMHPHPVVPVIPTLFEADPTTSSAADMDVDQMFAAATQGVDQPFGRKTLQHHSSLANIDTRAPNGRINSRRPRAQTYSSEIHPYYGGGGARGHRYQHSHVSAASSYQQHLNHHQWLDVSVGVGSVGGGDSSRSSASPHLGAILMDDNTHHHNSHHQHQHHRGAFSVGGSPHLGGAHHLLPSISPSPSQSHRSRDSPPIGGVDQDLMPVVARGGSYSQPGSSEHSPSSMLSGLPSSSSSELAAEQTPLAPLPNGYSYGLPTGDMNPAGGTTTATTTTTYITDTGLPLSTREQQMQNEIAQLRNRLWKVEFHAEQDRQKLREMQEVAHELERPLTKEVDEQFKAEWHNRTEARVTKLCSLNRAGNALCQWHDPRRERRLYPPRMAPHGKLNCGCTYEEALFEESLARHGIGAYVPGESVRMDPALRNPLLRLLKDRYGYKDGDFERFKVKVEGGEEYWRFPDNDGSEAWKSGSARVGNGPKRQKAP